ncbi:MAG: pyridoxine 5'-phosphate synthase [Bacteroidota bacterium]|jgi:pyridoxine 5-phosphate synthase
MTKLSVNINKIATLRNARGGSVPDVIKAALFIESCGAHGITVHPRPDQRHIRYEDVYNLKKVLKTEFNIEGNPTADFVKICKEVRPEQITLVPDAPEVLTSNAGWDTIKNKSFLINIISELKSFGSRVSIFIDPNPEMIFAAKETGCDRVELYTEAYASNYSLNREQSIAPFRIAADAAVKCGLVLNAGHDLSLENLNYFVKVIPEIAEVSIGHALISDALYMGLENTVKAYLKALEV